MLLLEALEAPLAWEGGYWKGMKMPLVASEACWRKTVELVEEEVSREVWSVVVVVDWGDRGMERMSMGMARRWQAKIAFMMGMYWWARSVDGEAVMRRMRDCSLFWSSDIVAVARWLVFVAELTPVTDSV